MVGILVSFWNGLFSGAFAVSFRFRVSETRHSSDIQVMWWLVTRHHFKWIFTEDEKTLQRGHLTGGAASSKAPPGIHAPKIPSKGLKHWHLNGNLPSVFLMMQTLKKIICFGFVLVFPNYVFNKSFGQWFLAATCSSICQGTTLPNTVSMVLVTTGPPKVVPARAGMRTRKSTSQKRRRNPVAFKRNTYSTRKTPEVLFECWCFWEYV